MTQLAFKLDYVFIYDPDKVPDDPKASEQDQMDAKRIFFYPPLTDINAQRNLQGFAEGVILFFNSFSTFPKSDSENRQKEVDGFNVLALDKKYLASKKVASSLILVIVFDCPSIDSAAQKDAYYSSEYLGLELLEQVFNNFLNTFCLFYGPFDTSPMNKIQLVRFTEVFHQFIEVYFRIGSANLVSVIDLIPGLIPRKKIPDDTLTCFVNLSQILKNISPNLYDVIAFKQGYFLFSGASAKMAEYFSNFFFDVSDVAKPKPDRDGLSNSVEIDSEFFYKRIECWKNSVIIGSNPDSLPPLYAKHLGLADSDLHFSVLNYFGYLLVFLWKSDRAVQDIYPAAIRLLKTGLKLESEPEEPLIHKNKLLYFYNCLNASMTNCPDTTIWRKLTREWLTRYLNLFCRLRENAKSTGVYFIGSRIGEPSLAVSFLNRRIATLYLENSANSDVLGELFDIRKKLKGIII